MLTCSHFDGTVTPPRADRCESCGSTFNLRVCTTCGHVGCCESQHGHNTAHAKATGHAVIKSLPLGEGHFTWCYQCRAYVSDPSSRGAGDGRKSGDGDSTASTSGKRRAGIGAAALLMSGIVAFMAWPPSAAEAGTPNRVTIEVPDASCAGCSLPVRRALKGAGGVVVVEEGDAKSRIVVGFEPAEGRPGVYVEAIRKAGFPNTRAVGGS